MPQLTLSFSIVVLLSIWRLTPLVAQEHILLGTAEVLDELQVAESMRAQLTAIHDKYSQIESMTFLTLSNGVPFQSLSSRQQLELRPRFLAAMIPVDTQARSEVAAILDAGQMTRLKQLRVQALGPTGLLAGKLNKQLEISDEQLESLRTAARTFHQEFTEIRVPAMSNVTAPEINDAFKAELSDRLVQALTDEQQKKYLEMTGERVTLPAIDHVR